MLELNDLFTINQKIVANFETINDKKSNTVKAIYDFGERDSKIKVMLSGIDERYLKDLNANEQGQIGDLVAGIYKSLYRDKTGEKFTLCGSELTFSGKDRPNVNGIGNQNRLINKNYHKIKEIILTSNNRSVMGSSTQDLSRKKSKASAPKKPTVREDVNELKEGISLVKDSLELINISLHGLAENILNANKSNNDLNIITVEGTQSEKPDINLSKIIELEGEISALKKEVTSLKNVNDETSKKLNTAQQGLDKLKKEIIVLKQKNQEIPLYTKENKDLLNQLNNSENEVEKLKEKITSNQKTIEDNQKAIKEKENLIKEKENSISALEDTNKKLNSEKSKLVSQFDSLNSEKLKLEESLKTSSKRLDEMLGVIEHDKINHTETKQLFESIKIQTTETIAKIELELSSLKEKNKELAVKVKKKEEELTKKVDQETYNKISVSFGELKVEHEKLKNEDLINVASVAFLESENANFKIKNEELAHVNVVFRENNKVLQQTIEKERLLLNTKNASEVTVLSGKLQDQERQFKAISASKDEAIESLKTQLEREKSKTPEQVVSTIFKGVTEEAHEELQKRTESQSEELKALKQENNNVVQEFNALQSQLQQLQTQNAQLISTQNELQQEIEGSAKFEEQAKSINELLIQRGATLTVADEESALNSFQLMPLLIQSLIESEKQRESKIGGESKRLGAVADLRVQKSKDAVQVMQTDLKVKEDQITRLLNEKEQLNEKNTNLERAFKRIDTDYKESLKSKEKIKQLELSLVDISNDLNKKIELINKKEIENASVKKELKDIQRKKVESETIIEQQRAEISEKHTELENAKAIKSIADGLLLKFKAEKEKIENELKISQSENAEMLENYGAANRAKQMAEQKYNSLHSQIESWKSQVDELDIKQLAEIQELKTEKDELLVELSKYVEKKFEDHFNVTVWSHIIKKIELVKVKEKEIAEDFEARLTGITKEYQLTQTPDQDSNKKLAVQLSIINQLDTLFNEIEESLPIPEEE